MKAIEFDDLWETLPPEEEWKTWAPIEKYRGIWNLARLGMIPEDEAVRIPPVEEWPEHANGIAFSYTTYKNVKEQDSVDWGMIQYIPRPAPAWAPKTREPVFLKNHGVGIFLGDSNVVEGRYAILFDGGEMSFCRDQVKPFSPEKIGLKWEEI